MRKFILFAIMGFALFSNLHSKLPIDNQNRIDYSNWDWEVLTVGNYQYFHNNRWCNPPQVPFVNYSSTTYLMNEIAEKEDYKREKGWRLIYADLTKSVPSFALYNVYTGVVRGFMLITEMEQMQRAVMSIVVKDKGSEKPMEWNNLFPGSSSILTSTFHYELPMKNDAFTVFAKCAPGQWVVFETPIVLNHKCTYQNLWWDISFYTTNEPKYTFDIEGVASTGKVDMSNQESVAVSHSASLNSGDAIDLSKEIISIASKVVNPIEDWATKASKISADIKKDSSIIKATGAYPKAILSYGKAIGVLAKAENVAKLLSSTIKGFDLVMGLYDLISGGGATAPTTYNISLKGKGTAVNLNSKQMIWKPLPGTTHINSSKFDSWEYSCPMGIIELVRTPELCMKYKSIPSEYYDVKMINFYIGDGQKMAYREFLFKDDLEFNIPNDIEVVDLKVAFTVQKSYNEAIMGEGFNSYIVSAGSIPRLKYYVNPIREKIDNGTYEIHLYQRDEKPYRDWMYKGTFIYGTPYLNPDEVKYLTFEDFGDEQDISKGTIYDDRIRLNVILRYKHKSDPKGEVLLYKGSYKCTYFQSGWPTDPTELAKIEAKKLESKKELNGGFRAVYGREIVLKDGLYGKGFRALPRNTTEKYGGVILSQTWDRSDCGGLVPFSTRSALATEEVEAAAAIEDEVVVKTKLYPNPTNGLVNLSGYEDVAKVEVYGVSGQLVEVFRDVEDSFDISNLADGMYIVRIHVDGDIQTHRVILQR